MEARCGGNQRICTRASSVQDQEAQQLLSVHRHAELLRREQPPTKVLRVQTKGTLASIRHHAILSSGEIHHINATYEVPLGSIISVRLRVNSTFGIPSKDILIPVGTEFDIVTYNSGTFPYSIFSYTEY